ncbi:hypothetical protein OA88_13565 [Flavobacterium sp. JRM]|nr:hypothetical protein OA88_13565 [Flavobacterium sp. JRM]
MRNNPNSVISKLISNPKNIFLLDSIGAFLTAFLLGFVLVRFQDSFGMPQKTLYILSVIAFIYATYSLCCYLFISNKWRFYLNIIMIANALYCCLTTGLIIYHFHKLTLLGIIYFILEIIIIVFLVYLEGSKGLKKALRF